MIEEIEYPSKERERAKVNVKVSAEVNTYLHDLYNQIQYEFCEQYEDEIKDLQQKVEQLEKEVNEYQKELEKADSITQSCIFQGKQESKISFRNCLNRLEQLENIRKEAIEYIKSYKIDYSPYELSDYNVRQILEILNKGSEDNE